MEKAHGIVIRLGKLGDTSFIVHWCTMQAGLIKTVAKGARRPKSPFAGKLDLFLEGELEWVRNRKSDLHVLKEVAVIDFKQELRTSYARTALAAYFGQLLERVVERDHPVPELFDLLARALDYLKGAPPSRKLLLRYERRVAERLGVGHEGANAAAALERAFGGLPKARSDCLTLLNNGE